MIHVSVISGIQVDEVQDLNGMQLAIIDLLTVKDNPMVMYLGDEQQAIFSFMGAKSGDTHPAQDAV